MANKYIGISGNAKIEVEGLVTSAGAGDAGKIVALDGSGKLSTTVMPTGIGADTKSLVTSENLSAGDLVNIYDNAAVATARKADASNGRTCNGFVLAGTTSPAAALVYLEGTITGLSSLTIGAPYFLSGSTPGAATATMPTTTSYLGQQVGTAISATELSFEPQEAITRA